MTTSITSSLPTQALAAPSVAPSVAPADITASSKSSTENTLASIADALMGLTTSTMQKSPGRHKMFARIERLVDSLARLIEAFSTFRGSSEQQTPLTAQSGAAASMAAGGTGDSSAIQGGQTTPNTPDSQATDLFSSAPPIDMSPSVDTEQTEVASTKQQAETPTQQPAPFNLGTLLSKSGGFLWKPTSDKNGDLVVLLPKKLTGRVEEVRVLSPDGKKTLGKGKYSGVGNGDREHFRFSKPGSGYPDGSIVYIKLEDGTTRHVKISDTSRRIQR